MAQKFLSGILLVISALMLTIATQVGGVLLLIWWPLLGIIYKKLSLKRFGFWFKLSGFVLCYLLFSLLIVPPIAKSFGRVPLPIFGSNQFKPLTAVTWLCNRHYVRPQLKQVIADLAIETQNQYPGSTLFYLDANFPFINGFPLVPHLSHSDGKKLDLAFFYTDAEGEILAGSPSMIGYGVNVDPIAGEPDQPDICRQRGSWQYSFMTAVVSQRKKAGYRFDAKRTKSMVQILANDPMVSKIFIEPHLKIRLGLSYLDKVRFHGCQAVRHDDHLHVQIK